MNYDYIISNLYWINHLEIDISVPFQDRVIVFVLLRAFNQNIFSRVGHALNLSFLLHPVRIVRVVCKLDPKF